jgi:hypothetical protein
MHVSYLFEFEKNCKLVQNQHLLSNTEVNGPAITVIWGQLFRESLVQNV